MRRIILFPGMALLTLTVLVGPACGLRSKPASGNGFAVVELFTSEGCSSCPPADAAVSDLNSQYPENVIVLEFHVDYWDRLGWKDPFSNPSYTARQRKYGDLFKLSSVYTPEVVVNGKTEFVGSDAGRLHSTIEKELANTGNLPIGASVKTSGQSVIVNYSFPKNDKLQLNIALLQRQASSAVKAGENAGRQLRHTNIVRDWKPSGNANGSLNLTIPEGLTSADCKLVLVLQDKDSQVVRGVRTLDIN